MEGTISTLFVVIPPRHLRALKMLVEQKGRDRFGGIGIGALRDEDEPFTLEHITDPLFSRGLIEDLTGTEMESSGKYFVRITRLGEVCLGLGIMLRESRKTTDVEMRILGGDLSPLAATAAKRLAQLDASEEKEAIA